jgi:hypothetical protein
MKDFAVKKTTRIRRARRKAAHQKVKLANVAKSENCFKRVIRKVRLIVKTLATFLTFGLLTFGAIFFFFPHLVSLNFDQNIVFYKTNIEGRMDQMYFASLKVDSPQIAVYQFDNNYQTSFLEKSNLKVIVQPLAQIELNQKSITLPKLSWLSGGVVNQAYEIPVEVAINQSQDLLKVVRQALIQDSAYLNWTELKDLVQLWGLMRRTDWQELRIVETDSLPKTAVLGSRCTVAILNTTEINNYAGSFSDLLEQSGLRVIRVDGVAEPVAQSRLLVDPSKIECSRVSEQIKKGVFLSESIVEEDQAIIKHYANRYRADMIILLGPDQFFN